MTPRVPDTYPDTKYKNTKWHKAFLDTKYCITKWHQAYQDTKYCITKWHQAFLNTLHCITNASQPLNGVWKGLFIFGDVEKWEIHCHSNFFFVKLIYSEVLW